MLVLAYCYSHQLMAQCVSNASFSWDNGAGSGNTWLESDISRTYTNIDGSGINLTLTLSDPDGQNCDAGNPSTFGDYTETTGGFGVGVLTYQMTSSNSNQEVTFTFDFSEPVLLDDFTMFDIDYNGSTTDAVSSFQDEVEFSASNSSTNVPISLSQHPSATSSTVNIFGQIARSIFVSGGSGNVSHTDVNGAVVVTTTGPIDQLVISYSNGPDDDGQSDDHAVTIPGFIFCETPADTDSDGVYDISDLDDDNDGILDEIESCGALGGGSVPILIEIQLDNFPGETSWALTNSGGSTVASGSGYVDVNAFISETENVPAGDYTFTINDSYGDGLTSTGGYYQISVDGSIVVGPVNTAFSSNSHNLTAGTAPFSCIGGDPTADDDNDGLLNYEDSDFCTLNAQGVCTSLDTDGDGIIDQLDLDSDGDGCYDAEEAGHGESMEGDNTIVATSAEVGSNGFDNNVETDDTQAADHNYPLMETNMGTFDFQDAALCAAPPLDSDGDGIADKDDLDDDNDGLPDILENRCDQPSVANSVSGSGAYQDQIYFFQWTDTDFNDGLQDGDSQTFNLPDGLSITVTFSNVVNGSTYVPTDMQTWGGAFLHQLYNAAGADEALYGADGVDASFSVNFVATKNGLPFPLDLLALDAESTYPGNESLSFTTNGSNWQAVETYGGGGVWTGVNTQTVVATDTELSGGNTIYYSQGASKVDIVIDAGGREAVAFGIFLTCDSDNDGVPNHLDLDADNDGIPDLVEAGGIDTDGNGRVDYPTPGDPTSMVDADNDGLADALDNQNSGDASEVTSGTPLDNLDSDNDGLKDMVDLDADNDGIPDLVEAGGIDSNGDGRVDTATDGDSDGLADVYDEAASDGPGTGGSNGTALVETDGSGNMQDGSGSSIDTDGDGLADFLDLDSDNDGIADLVEAGGVDATGIGKVDTGVSPWDGDGDGLADIYDENALDGPGVGGINGTALVETSADANANGIVDGAESMLAGSASNNINVDSDTAPNHLDIDSDNDGIVDIIETGGTDTDNDGMVDNLPVNDADGWLDAMTGVILTMADGADGDPYPDYATGAGKPDFDGDGIANYLDIDADNDGIVDNTEGQATGAYQAPTTDSDGDGLSDAYEVPGTIGSFGGVGISPENTDSSGEADYLDIDSDDDGELDTIEGHDTDNDGVADSGSAANTGLATGVDADFDGLDDGYDNNNASLDPTNTNTNPSSYPDTDAGLADQDWRATNQNIAGLVWEDGDEDGEFDDTESPLSGVTVTLFNSADAVVTSTTTNADGMYLIPDLPVAMGYYVVFTKPVTHGYFSPQNMAGGDDTVDSDVDNTGRTAGINVPSGTAFIYIYAGVFGAPLPVTLSQFQGKAQDCEAYLSWATASEENFSFFGIERSRDGRSFEQVGHVQAKGEGANSYQYSESLSGKRFFYRLRNVDMDGQSKYSPLIVVESDCQTQDALLKAFPNPVGANGDLQLSFYQTQGMKSIIVVDAWGKQIIQRPLDLEYEQEVLISIDVSELAAGMYTVLIEGDGLSGQARFIRSE